MQTINISDHFNPLKPLKKYANNERYSKGQFLPDILSHRVIIKQKILFHFLLLLSLLFKYPFWVKLTQNISRETFDMSLDYWLFCMNIWVIHVGSHLGEIQSRVHFHRIPQIGAVWGSSAYLFILFLNNHQINDYEDMESHFICRSTLELNVCTIIICFISDSHRW